MSDTESTQSVPEAPQGAAVAEGTPPEVQKAIDEAGEPVAPAEPPRTFEREAQQGFIEVVDARTGEVIKRYEKQSPPPVLAEAKPDDVP